MLGGARAGLLGAAGAQEEEPAPDISLDARTSYNGTSTIDPHTFAHTIGAGANFLIVKLGYESSRTVSAVRSGAAGAGSSGQLLTLDATSAREEATGGVINTQIWYLANPTTGVREIWIDFNSTTIVGAAAVSLNNVDTASPIADSDGGTTTTGASVVCATALVPDGTCWLETVACDGQSNSIDTFTWNSSITQDLFVDPGVCKLSGGNRAGVVANITPQCTRDQVGNNDWALSCILLRKAA